MNKYYTVIIEVEKTYYTDFYNPPITEDVEYLIKNRKGDLHVVCVPSSGYLSEDTLMFVEHKYAEAFRVSNHNTKFSKYFNNFFRYLSSRVVEIQPKFTKPVLLGYEYVCPN